MAANYATDQAKFGEGTGCRTDETSALAIAYWRRNFVDHRRNIDERKFQNLMNEEEFWRLKGTVVCFLVCDTCAIKTRLDPTHKCLHGHCVAWKTNGDRSSTCFWDQDFPDGVRSKAVTRGQEKKKMEFIKNLRNMTIADFEFARKAQWTP
jgi:hypothetical protein